MSILVDSIVGFFKNQTETKNKKSAEQIYLDLTFLIKTIQC